MSKVDQKPYNDLAENKTVAVLPDKPVSTIEIPCAWCDETFQTKDQPKKHI